MQEMPVWFLGWEEPMEKELATHSSILAWEIPRRKKPERLQSMGSQRVRLDWVTKQRGLRRWNRTWRLRCRGTGVRNDSQTPSLRTWVENFPLCFLRELDISQELLVGVMPSFRKKLPENGANIEENETKAETVKLLWCPYFMPLDRLSQISLLFIQSCPTLRPHELQHTRLLCPSLTCWVCSLLSIKSVMPSNHLILCRPLLLLSSIFPGIKGFSGESVLCIRWSIGASTSVLPVNIQGWFPLGLTGLISLLLQIYDWMFWTHESINSPFDFLVMAVF